MSTSVSNEGHTKREREVHGPDQQAVSPMKCNVKDRSDGSNIAMGCACGFWVGNTLSPACNKPAVAVGEWRKHEGRVAFVYPCADHLELWRNYDFEEKINRGWFKLVGRIRKWSESPEGD